MVFFHLIPQWILLIYTWCAKEFYYYKMYACIIWQLTYLIGRSCRFLPGFDVVCLKLSCVSFFWVGPKWSFLSNGITLLWVEELVATFSDANALVNSVKTLSRPLKSSTSSTADTILAAHRLIVFLLAIIITRIREQLYRTLFLY